MTDATANPTASLHLRVRVWGLVAACGAVVSVSTVLGFLGAFGWVLDLFSHFRVQYFLALSVVSLILLIPRHYKCAGGFGALALVNLWTIAPLYFGGSTAPNNAAPRYRALQINVNTGRGEVASVARVLQQYAPDIVLLEEVSARWIYGLRGALEQYPYSKTEPRGDNFGIGLYSKLPFARSEIVSLGPAGVPSVLAELKTPAGLCTVIGTHPLPPVGARNSRFRNEQLGELPALVRTATSPVLLLGDLNISPWSPHFRRLLRNSGLRDSSRGWGPQPTWPTHNLLLRIPIDHCLHSASVHIAGRLVGPNVGSDHYPVIVDFTIREGLSVVRQACPETSG